MNGSELLLKLRMGDNAAFFELVDTYSYKVINTCYRFLLNKEDAEDISQEVFLEVFQSVNDFREEAQLSTWIYRITIFKCLDEIKKRNRKKRLVAFGKKLQLDEVASWLAGTQNSDKKIIDSENTNLIHTLLNTLPDSQRVAFTLSKIDGFTIAEIAEIMSTSSRSVEALIYRAKMNVGEAIKNILKN